MFAIHLVYGTKFSSPLDVRALWIEHPELNQQYRLLQSRMDSAFYIVKNCDHVNPMEVSVNELMRERERWLVTMSNDQKLWAFIIEKVGLKNPAPLDIFLLDPATIV